MGFSRGQQKHYRPLVAKAWRSHCARLGLDLNNRAAKETWYRQEVMAAIGEYTTSALNRSDDFDQVMLHFALIAGDQFWIEKMAHGKETRMIYLIGCRLRDLDRLEEGSVHTWEYARSIYDHMGLPADIQDCPAGLLWKVFQSLDTHVRRLTSRLENAAC